MASEDSTLRLMDKALARYYKQHDCEYLDEDGIGKIEKWAEDNGFDTDGVEDELFEQEPDQSQLLLFDTDFPSKKGQQLSAIEIINILKRCWNKPHEAYTNEVPPLEVTVEHWNFPETQTKYGQPINKEIEETKEIYKSQCITIFDQAIETDQAIIKLLAVGRRLNEPYLSLLAGILHK